MLGITMKTLLVQENQGLINFPNPTLFATIYHNFNNRRMGRKPSSHKSKITIL